MFEQHAFTDGTPIKLPAITPKLSETPGETRWLGPELGEHTAEVLRGLGYDEQYIARLRSEKII
jgi:formyl-CoA transferase